MGQQVLGANLGNIARPCLRVKQSSLLAKFTGRQGSSNSSQESGRQQRSQREPGKDLGMLGEPQQVHITEDESE